MSSIYYFDPTGFGFESDILVQRLQGLGRGKGFKVAQARSIFESDTTSVMEGALDRLGSRTLEIMSMMLDNHVITQEDLLDRLGLTPSGRSDLAAQVVEFLESIEELLYDADEETQRLALELRTEPHSQRNPRPLLVLLRALALSSCP